MYRFQWKYYEWKKIVYSIKQYEQRLVGSESR